MVLAVDRVVVNAGGLFAERATIPDQADNIFVIKLAGVKRDKREEAADGEGRKVPGPGRHDLSAKDEVGGLPVSEAYLLPELAIGCPQADVRAGFEGSVVGGRGEVSDGADSRAGGVQHTGGAWAVEQFHGASSKLHILCDGGAKLQRREGGSQHSAAYGMKGLHARQDTPRPGAPFRVAMAPEKATRTCR